MKITTISYKKIFPIIQFVNETIGVEIQIDTNDNPDQAFKYAKKLVEEWHEKGSSTDKPLNGNHVEQVIDWSEEKLEIAIENATSVEELGKLREKLPISLKGEFMKKLNELTAKIK